MAFEITITAEAEAQLLRLPVREQRIIGAAFSTRLADQPTTTTRAIRRLRPNSLAQYELRVGDLRVLYNVEEKIVVVLVVGRKIGNKLFVNDEEFHGHKDNPTEPAGGGPERDPQ